MGDRPTFAEALRADWFARIVAVQSGSDCDTSGVARKVRQIEQVDFNPSGTDEVVARMDRLAGAGDGWINLIPKVGDDDVRPTTLSFFTLLSGGGSGVTMCTWVPGSFERRGHGQPTLGITHVSGGRAVAVLRSRSVVVPERWHVEQDHPRRGLVVRVPTEESHAESLAWALRALGALGVRPVRGWRADVYLPMAS